MIIKRKRQYPEHYRRWDSMKSRCLNPSAPNYKNYGGRGIFICTEWQTFKSFQKWAKKTYEPGKTLDRINNDGPYSPQNCRWATPHEQRVNTRTTHLVIKKYKKAGVFLTNLMRTKYGDPKKRKVKICPNCKIMKKNEDYNFSRNQKDNREGYCRACKSKRRKLQLLKEKHTIRVG